MSIRYTLKSLIPYGKTANLAQLFKDFFHIAAENHVFLMEVALNYHFTLNSVKISRKQCDFL